MKHKTGSATFSSVDMTTDTIEQVKDRQENEYKVIPFHIDPIDKYFGAMLPGHLCVIQAQTSNGKSLLIDNWCNYLAERFINHKENEIIIKVDLETYIEDHGMIEIAKRSNETVSGLASGKVKDWQKLMEAVFEINQLGLYRITYGNKRLEDIENLSMNKIVEEVRHLMYKKYNRKLKVAAIFVDYLQAIEYDNVDDNDRRLKVRQDVFALRKMGNEFKCPIIVGVQAKQTLSGYEHKDLMIPGIYDGEETASIAQRADRVVSLWMPKMSHSIGKMLSNIGNLGNVRVQSNTLFIKVNKQRGGLPSGDRWLCEVDYSTNDIKVIGKV